MIRVAASSEVRVVNSFEPTLRSTTNRQFDDSPDPRSRGELNAIEMAKKKTRIPHKYLPWIEARKKFRLSHAHIQMARELGMNPKRFGSMANSDQQPWKLPLPEFIEHLYEKQFGKTRPDVVRSIEEMAAAHMAKRAARKAAKEAGRLEEARQPESEPESESIPQVPAGE